MRKIMLWLAAAFLFLPCIGHAQGGVGLTATAIIGSATAITSTVTPCFYFSGAVNVISYNNTQFYCNSDGTYHSWGGGGGSGTINAALQFAETYYSGAGSTSTVSGLAAPTTNGFYFTGYNISGSAASAPIDTLSTSLPAGFSFGSLDTGTPQITWSANLMTFNQPVAIAGSVGLENFTEGVCSGAASGIDVLCGDATSHGLKNSNNNGPFFHVPQVIASGTAAMGTGAISSGTCATVVTVAATGALTTDVFEAVPNTDPTAVTGYGPSASGSLYVQGYPTAGNVNFKVCNNTSSTITPSALTLNWSVTR